MTVRDGVRSVALEPVVERVGPSGPIDTMPAIVAEFIRSEERRREERGPEPLVVEVPARHHSPAPTPPPPATGYSEWEGEPARRAPALGLYQRLSVNGVGRGAWTPANVRDHSSHQGWVGSDILPELLPRLYEGRLVGLGRGRAYVEMPAPGPASTCASPQWHDEDTDDSSDGLYDGYTSGY